MLACWGLGAAYTWVTASPFGGTARAVAATARCLGPPHAQAGTAPPNAPSPHRPPACRYRDAAAAALPSRKKGYDLKGILAKCGVRVTAVPMGRQSADQAMERYATATLLLGRQPGAGAKGGSKGQQGKVPGARGGKVVAGRMAAEEQEEGEEELPGPWDGVDEEAWRELWQDDGEREEVDEDEEEDEEDWGYGYGYGGGRMREELPMSLRVRAVEGREVGWGGVGAGQAEAMHVG